MKKGFTLIELLAVIVILAIITMIATPIVLNIIKDSEKNAIKRDTESIARAIQMKMVSSNIDVGSLTKNDLDDLVKIDASKYDAFGATIVNNQVVVTLVKNNLIYENKLDSKVYGASWSGTGSSLTRTNDAVGLTYTVNASTINSDFDNAEIYKDMIEVTDSYGNQFIKIPKFYIKKTVNGNNWTWQISLTKQDNDYYLPACFYDEETGKILPYVLVGKYNASLSTDGTKLESKTGRIPLVYKTINEFRNYAKANNIGEIKGYQLLDIHIVDILQTLFYIEFATLNSQSIMQGFAIGQFTNTHVATVTVSNSNVVTISPAYASLYRVGQTIDIGTTFSGRQVAKDRLITAINTTTGAITFNGASVNIAIGNYVYNVSYITGTTNNISTSSGSPVSNTEGRYGMKYRGIENLWGNIFQFVDGMNIRNNVSYVAVDASQYASDIFTGAYSQLGYSNATIQDNYVVRMGFDSNKPFIQLPVVVSNVYSDSGYKDYYFENTNDRVVQIGGVWSNNMLTSKKAGITTWILNNSSISTLMYGGSRLAKTP